jgi:MYXO-CTERM domain-containing protein
VERSVPDSVPPAFSHQVQHDRLLAHEANLVLAEILGPGRARVSVRSTWNDDRHTLRTEKPGRRVVQHESRTFSGEAVEPTVTEETDYSAAHTSEERVRATPRLARLSVALFLDPTAPDSPELRAAVQAVVGFDPARGDEFRTVVLPFAAPVVRPAAGVRPPEPSSFPVWAAQGLLAALAALGIAFAWRRRPRSTPAPRTSAPPRVEPDAAPPASAARTRVAAAVAADPARVGAVLSRWAREEELEGVR